MSEADVTDPADLLSLMGESRRVAIVEALVERRQEAPEDPALSFSALREASGIEDKGNFNYHLDRLRGHFVRKTDAGYELSPAGSKVAGVLLSDLYGDRVERAVSDEECPYDACEAHVVVSLRGGRAQVRCAEDHVVFESSVPPGATEGRSASELLALASFFWQQVLDLHAQGACFECFGHEVGEIELRDVSNDDAIDADTLPVYRSLCERCGLQFRTPPGAVLVRHPAFVSLCHDHGIDSRNRPPWRLPVLDGGRTEVVSEDPVRVRVTAEIDDDAVAFELDGDAAVVDVSEDR